jgi:hypothetical protein
VVVARNNLNAQSSNPVTRSSDALSRLFQNYITSWRLVARVHDNTLEARQSPAYVRVP